MRDNESRVIRDYEVMRYYNALMKHYISSGKTQMEASKLTMFDIEVRFCIKKSVIHRARNRMIRLYNNPVLKAEFEMRIGVLNNILKVVQDEC